jgi:nucleotide-binding universal stress UspA family protein
VTTYVVGLAGSEDAQHALDWAVGVAEERDSIIAVHSWEIPIVTGYESVAAIDTRAIEQSASDFLREALGGVDERVRGQLVSGHPGRSLVDTAAEVVEGGDEAVVVVGHAGSSKVGLLLGSTANYVIHHARSPVVVVRGEVRLPVRTVVVGVDDPHEDHPDEPSLQALRWALRLPCATRVEVHHAAFVPGVAAGRIAQPSIESTEEIDELDRQLEEAIAAALDGVQSESGAEIVPVVTGGTGAFAMIEASRTADLIVIGTRGHSGLRQLITGSTTLEVTAHAHCPVVVVR